MPKSGLRIALLTAAATLAATFSAATPAFGNARAVISDCNANGQLVGHYSRSDLQSALNGMGADIKEYTNCYDVIRSALIAGVTSGKAGGPGPGGLASGAGVGSARAVNLDGHSIRPDTGGSGNLPGPLVGVLILLCLVALGSGGLTLHHRVIARHGA